jgi:hypothetical protein
MMMHINLDAMGERSIGQALGGEQNLHNRFINRKFLKAAGARCTMVQERLSVSAPTQRSAADMYSTM